MPKKWDGPTTNSLRKRNREVREDGVVKGKAVPAMVAGCCGLLGITILLLVHFL